MFLKKPLFPRKDQPEVSSNPPFDIRELAVKILCHEAMRWVGVKEEGVNSGQIIKYFQKTVDGVAEGEAWCFPAGFEVLTSNGFVRFDELVPENLVASINENNEVVYSKYEKIEKEYSGAGYHVQTRSLDFVCDKGHRFWGNNQGSIISKFITLDEVITAGFVIPNIFSFKEAGGNALSDLDIQFLAAFIADGSMKKSHVECDHYYSVCIQVSKSRKINFIKKTFGDLITREYVRKKTYNKETFPATSFQFKIPNHFEDIFSSYKVLSHDFINTLSKEQAVLFLNTYKVFDGDSEDSEEDTGFELFSSNEEVVDNLQLIALRAGLACTIRKTLGSIERKDSYVISINSSRTTRHLKKSNISEVTLNETLHCVSVPDGRILVRNPENKNFLLVGNCLSFAMSVCKAARDLFRVIDPTFIPLSLFATEHCMTLWKNTPASQRLSEPEKGCIVLWQHYDSSNRPTTNGHCGIVVDVDSKGNLITVEGNTSSGKNIDRDGQGVYQRSRPRGGVGKMKEVGFVKLIP